MVDIVHGACIAHSHRIEMRQHIVNTLKESLPVLGFLRSPCHIGKSHQARIQQIIYVLRTVAEFCPQRTLYAHQQIGIFRLPVALHRFVVVNILQRVIAEISQRLKPLRTLIAYQIQHAGRCHYKTMALFGSFQSSFAQSLPSKDDDIVGQRAVGQFIPTHHFLTFALDILAHATHEIALQFFNMFDAFRFHTGLTFRTFFPVIFRSLITTEMNVFRREKLDNFINYIFKETENAVVSGTIDNTAVLYS